MTRTTTTLIAIALLLAGPGCGGEEEPVEEGLRGRMSTDAGVDAEAGAGSGGGGGSGGSYLPAAAAAGGMVIALGPCRAFCAATYSANSPIPFVTSPYQQCENMCRYAVKVGCNGLWNRCMWLGQLLKSGSAAPGAKKTVEMCLLMYNTLGCR